MGKLYARRGELVADLLLVAGKLATRHRVRLREDRNDRDARVQLAQEGEVDLLAAVRHEHVENDIDGGGASSRVGSRQLAMHLALLHQCRLELLVDVARDNAEGALEAERVSPAWRVDEASRKGDGARRAWGGDARILLGALPEEAAPRLVVGVRKLEHN